MRHFLTILLFLLFLPSLVFSSDEPCYVGIKTSKEFNSVLVSEISTSLISQYIHKVQSFPSSGLSGQPSCIYEVSVTKDGEKTFVTLKGNDLNSFGDSTQEGTDGFQESILRSIYRSQRDKRNLICGDYGNLLEECGGGKVRLGKVDKTKRVESVPSVPTPKVETVTTTETQSNGKFEGRYQITHAENTEGFFATWENGVYLDISKMGENLYMVNINGIGKVNGQNVDCSDPPIFTMKLDSDGNQLNRIDIAKGSCPISKFVPVREEGIIGSPLSQYTRWENTLEGLKKTKRWSVTGEICVVGPCKGIRFATHIFYYKRIK